MSPTLNPLACPRCSRVHTEPEVKQMISAYARGKRTSLGGRPAEQVTCRCCKATMTRNEYSVLHICPLAKQSKAKFERLVKSIKLEPGPQMLDDPRDAFPGRRVLRCDAEAAIERAVMDKTIIAKRFSDKDQQFKWYFNWIGSEESRFFQPGFILETAS